MVGDMTIVMQGIGHQQSLAAAACLPEKTPTFGGFSNVETGKIKQSPIQIFWSCFVAIGSKDGRETNQSIHSQNILGATQEPGSTPWPDLSKEGQHDMYDKDRAQLLVTYM